MPLDEVTQLLRRGDPSLVEADLVDLLVTGEEEWLKDDRDLMMALAPHHDCARRLGADVAALFRRAAAAGPASLRELVEEFGRRSDVSPEAFGFCVEQTREGLRYRWAAPPVDLEQLRRAGRAAAARCRFRLRAGSGHVEGSGSGKPQESAAALGGSSLPSGSRIRRQWTAARARALQAILVAMLLRRDEYSGGHDHGIRQPQPPRYARSERCPP